jgi:P4 family phage/plasmid primase-like protien
MNFKERATPLIAMGLRVIPVTPHDKDCKLVGWPKLATTDPAQVEAWNCENPNFNVGVMASPDSVCILDDDAGDLAEQVLRDTGREIPSTYTVRTRKGHHYYFLPTDASRALGNRREGMLLDFQENRRYVVGANSIHSTGIIYKVVNDAPLAPIPDVVVEWIGSKTKKAKETVVLGQDTGGTGDLAANLRWMYGYLKNNNVEVHAEQFHNYTNRDGLEGKRLHVICPNQDEHTTDSNISASSLFVYAQGFGYECQHSHCGDIGWKEFKAMTEIPFEEMQKKWPVEDASLVMEQLAEEVEEVTEFPIEGEIECTNLGNAMRLVKRYGNDLRYCHGKKKWFIWNNKYWMIDEKNRIYRLMVQVIQQDIPEEGEIEAEKARANAPAGKGEEAYDDVIEFYRKFRLASENRIHESITLAQNLYKIPVTITQFDRDHMLLNVKNGVVDLRTGELQRAARTNLCSKIANIEYNKELRCPQWITFLNTIFNGNQEIIGYVQRAVGYSLTGDTTEQCFFILHGNGANGKSVFTDTIRTLLGDYAKTAEFNTFMVRNNDAIRNDLAGLVGSRFVLAAEGDMGKRLSESVIKTITGGEEVSARFLNCEFFTHTPTYKIWLVTNHRPRIAGTDIGIWRRVILIPFEVTIPKEEQDKRLGEKLKEELGGILNWALEGLAQWQATGLHPPEEVMHATSQYKDNEDVFGMFVTEECVECKYSEIPSSVIYAAYAEWAKEMNSYVVNRVEFSKKMEEKGFVKDRKSSGNFFLGIKLRRGYTPTTVSEYSRGGIRVDEPSLADIEDLN